MYKTLRPLLFKLDPERAHGLAFKAAKWTAPVRSLLSRGISSDEVLSQKIAGLDFYGPLSIAAGLDKNAELLSTWKGSGCGFVEVGSVSARPCAGNERPRAFRLKKDEAIINRMGLNNHGVAAVSSRVAASSLGIPIGINIAKTHDPSITGEAGFEDMITSIKTAAAVASYITINISCPNTKEGKTFEDPSMLDDLLARVDQLRLPLPVFVKLSPDPSQDAVEKTVEVILRHKVDGIVAVNTSSQRKNISSVELAKEIGRGGLSGKPLTAIARERVADIYRLVGKSKPIIGVGGIHDVASAYAMVKAGASLLQIYTGLVYEGPGLFKRINKGLRAQLKKDGYKNISEAVGADA